MRVIPVCPGSRSDATKQQSRTSVLMVTAKRAQLLLALFIGLWQRRVGERVTQSLGQLGGRDGEAAQTLSGCVEARYATAVPAARPRKARPWPDSLPPEALGSCDTGHRAGVVEKTWGYPLS